MLSVPAQVGVELAEILVREPVALELDENVALEDAVVEDQVYEERRIEANTSRTNICSTSLTRHES